MFTGLVEEVGTVRQVQRTGDGAEVTVNAKVVTDDLQVGDSVNILGACQTVVRFERESLTVQAVRETLQKTRLGDLKPGDRVNLERAMRPSDRLGGHIVQGHVDGMVDLRSVSRNKLSWRLTLSLPESGRPFVVEKGSVALDGVSLTVASLTDTSFDVEIIPHTWENTSLNELKSGQNVHVEWDLIAKYVARQVGAMQPGSGLTVEKLIQAGFGPSNRS